MTSFLGSVLRSAASAASSISGYITSTSNAAASASSVDQLPPPPPAPTRTLTPAQQFTQDLDAFVLRVTTSDPVVRATNKPLYIAEYSSLLSRAQALQGQDPQSVSASAGQSLTRMRALLTEPTPAEKLATDIAIFRAKINGYSPEAPEAFERDKQTLIATFNDLHARGTVLLGQNTRSISENDTQFLWVVHALLAPPAPTPAVASTVVAPLPPPPQPPRVAPAVVASPPPPPQPSYTQAPQPATVVSSPAPAQPAVAQPLAYYQGLALQELGNRGYIEFYGQDITDPVTYFLGNFSPAPVELDGLRFTCAEAAFQAGKFQQRRDIMQMFCTLDGDAAWRLARDLEKGANGQPRIGVPASWKDRYENVLWMARVLDAKFTQNRELAQLLLATGNAFLVEVTPFTTDPSTGQVTGRRDSFWGCPTNQLGTCLMRVREKLRGSTAPTPPKPANLNYDALTWGYSNWIRPSIALPIPFPPGFNSLPNTISGIRATFAPGFHFTGTADPAAASAPTTTTARSLSRGHGALVVPPGVTTSLTMTQGNIVQQDNVQAIVNPAANPQLQTGGAVSGAIFNAAGTGLDALCQALPIVGPGNARCRTTEAVITGSAALASRGIQNIVHALPPVYTPPTIPRDTPDFQRAFQAAHIGSIQALHQTYWNLLTAAKDNNIRSLAIPAIGTYTYGYPAALAASVQKQAISEFLVRHPNHFTELRLVYYSHAEFNEAHRVLY